MSAGDQVDDVDDGALFGIDELAMIDPARTGRVEAGTYAALRQGSEDGVVMKLDAGLAAAALATARRLDQAEEIAGRSGGALAMKAGYLYAQLVPPYRELMQALRLPAAVQPAEEPRSPAAPTTSADVPSWLHDGFGRPE